MVSIQQELTLNSFLQDALTSDLPPAGEKGNELGCVKTPVTKMKLIKSKDGKTGQWKHLETGIQFAQNNKMYVKGKNGVTYEGSYKCEGEKIIPAWEKGATKFCRTHIPPERKDPTKSTDQNEKALSWWLKNVKKKNKNSKWKDYIRASELCRTKIESASEMTGGQPKGRLRQTKQTNTVVG